jgi:RNA 2',3'-cyclic 3'-phosphodiesterase
VSGERARLFVALELPGSVRCALFAWAREQVDEMPRVRPVDPESLHVTLCFLGARPLAEVDGIIAACAAIAGLPAAALALGAALWLPPRRPRVLTVELADEQGRLAAAQSALSRALRDGGFYEPEKRPFLAHVTVARVQREGRPPRAELPAPEPLRFTGATVTLFRSHLGGGPARYQGLASVSLHE